VAGVRAIALIIAAVSLLAAATHVCLAQSPDQAITYHGVEFPAAFADGERFDPRDYEPTNPGLGFSAGYRHRGAISTVYVYDLRQTSIPDNIAAAPVVQQFEQANSDIRRSWPAAGTLASKGVFTVADGRGRPRLKCEGYDGDRGNGVPLHTYVCVGAAKGKFFKIRTTMPRQDGSLDEVKRFVGAWVGKLWKS
jgi:hypothetical protein